jgi:hypothetical protein
VYIEIDPSVVPATTLLQEAEDFTSFKVVVRAADHAWVPVQSLEQLAADRAVDPQWRQGFETMLDYARQRGCVQDGAVRAHIEWPRASET